MRHKKGFTLIELLVVIAIIGILATIIIISYNNAQDRARDNRRKTDIQSVSTAVEMYRIDTKSYPFKESASGFYRIRSCNPTNWSYFDSLLNGYAGTPFPADPKDFDSSKNETTWHAYNGDFTYTYLSTRDSYVLAARLKVSKDGNGDDFDGKTVKNKQGSAIYPLTQSADVDDSLVNFDVPANELYFVGSNLLAAPVTP